MTLLWARTWDALSAVLFPTACVSCPGLIIAADPPLCAACWSRLPLIETACACGTPRPESSGRECGRCRRGLSPLSRGLSLGYYAGPLRDAVLALKYAGRHRAADRLGVRLLAHARCLSILEDADLIVPVPLHPRRFKERGFNQSELLAAALTKTGRGRLSRCLVRIRNTPSQTDLNARQRRRNVRDAFSTLPEPSLAGAVVVLVDDVLTTGATLRECASVLRKSGAREVRSITVARAE